MSIKFGEMAPKLGDLCHTSACINYILADLKFGDGLKPSPQFPTSFSSAIYTVIIAGSRPHTLVVVV